MKKYLILTALGTVLSASSAFAANIVVYTGAVGTGLGTAYAAFNASTVVGGAATINEAFSTNVSMFDNFSLTQNGASPDGFVRGFAGQRVTQVSTNGESETVGLLVGNMTAVGADWNLSPGGAGQFVVLTIRFANNTTQTIETLGQTVGNSNSPFFFGFTSDVEFASFTLSAGTGSGIAERFNYDNLLAERSGSIIIDPEPGPGPVPEPSTLGLMGLAMAGLGLVRRFRR
jgi:hypothetical protein